MCDRSGGFEAVHLLLRINLKTKLAATSGGQHRAAQAGDKAVTMQKAALSFPVCSQLKLSGNWEIPSGGLWPGCHSLRDALELNPEFSLALAEMLGINLLRY